ncbi:hypothetical protein WA026_020219 [Henosepilachna vigintioctopunctata]|uniref:Uncharacterized protein n=1 Tax=Henosepilachna vigintioctopunctata TaxID=420089 RepID=A0AAW1U2U2_9CUCU
MMQIFLIPGFKCCFCKCVAHPEIAKEMDVVTCPYCDIPMDQVYSCEKFESILNKVDDRLKEKLEYVFQKDVPEKPLIKVPEDSNIEQISLEHMDDSDVNYLALTDSEDEESATEKINFIRSKFFDSMNTSSPPVRRSEDLDLANSSIPSESEVHVEENSDYSFDESDTENNISPQ